MRKRNSFTLIEAVVTLGIVVILSVAFAPGLVKRQQQAEMDQVITMITSAVQETKSLAISPTRVDVGVTNGSNIETGKVLQAWLMVLNMHPTNASPYCYPVENGGTAPCGFAGVGQETLMIPPHSYVIMAARDTNPFYTRRIIKKVNLPNINKSNIRLYYNFPCHYGDTYEQDPNCPGFSGTGEPYIWKLHFRHLDGAIGYAGKYYNYPESFDGYDTGYWTPMMWGNSCISSTSCPQHTTDLVVVGGTLSGTNGPNGPESNVGLCSNGIYNGDQNKKCKIIHIDNITGAVNVGI